MAKVTLIEEFEARASFKKKLMHVRISDVGGGNTTEGRVGCCRAEILYEMNTQLDYVERRMKIHGHKRTKNKIIYSLQDIGPITFVRTFYFDSSKDD